MQIWIIRRFGHERGKSQRPSMLRPKQPSTMAFAHNLWEENARHFAPGGAT